MENKMDEVRKISLGDMEDVSGGTWTENREISAAMNEAHEKGLHLNADSANIFHDVRSERNLDKIGIECHASSGCWGIGSVNNTYRDKETGQYILHEEVLDYIRTGQKSWRK